MTRLDEAHDRLSDALLAAKRGHETQAAVELHRAIDAAAEGR